MSDISALNSIPTLAKTKRVTERVCFMGIAELNKEDKS